jgi:hypothetical protein
MVFARIAVRGLLHERGSGELVCCEAGDVLMMKSEAMFKGSSKPSQWIGTWCEAHRQRGVKWFAEAPAQLDRINP